MSNVHEGVATLGREAPWPHQIKSRQCRRRKTPVHVAGCRAAEVRQGKTLQVIGPSR